MDTVKNLAAFIFDATEGLFVPVFGCVDISAHPDESTGQSSKAKVTKRYLGESSEYTTIMLDYVDETRHQLSFSVEKCIVLTQLCAIGLWRNHNLRIKFVVQL